MPFFVADRGRVFSALSFVLLLRYREVAGLLTGDERRRLLQDNSPTEEVECSIPWDRQQRERKRQEALRGYGSMWVHR